MQRTVIGGNNAAKHVQAYFEYKNIVGDADGGVMMSEKEFEDYKKKHGSQMKGPQSFIDMAD